MGPPLENGVGIDLEGSDRYVREARDRLLDDELDDRGQAEGRRVQLIVLE